MNTKMLVNPHIHKYARLEKGEFLKRVQNIKQVRVSDIYIDLFPSEEKEYSWISDLYQIINNGNFQTRLRGGDGQIYGIEIRKGIYDWFKNNELSLIQKQILNWISAIYLHNRQSRKIIENTVFPLLNSEILKVISQHYSPDFDSRYDLSKFDYGGKYEQYSEEYERALISYTGTDNYPAFLENPFRKAYTFNHLGIRNSPKIKVSLGYFTEHDWVGIVERDFKKYLKLRESNLKNEVYTEKEVKKIFDSYVEDDMNRAEGESEFWEKWKYTYLNYEKTNDFEYKITGDDIKKQFVYVVREGDTNIYKIGHTKEIEGFKRGKGMQTSNSKELVLVGYFRSAGTNAEKALHRFFSANRKRGEFFELTNKDVSNILDVNWRRDNCIF